MTMGSDFQYENANMWFKNLDKLIHLVNAQVSVPTPCVRACFCLRALGQMSSYVCYLSILLPQT